MLEASRPNRSWEAVMRSNHLFTNEDNIFAGVVVQKFGSRLGKCFSLYGVIRQWRSADLAGLQIAFTGHRIEGRERSGLFHLVLVRSSNQLAVGLEPSAIRRAITQPFRIGPLLVACESVFPIKFGEKILEARSHGN